MIRTLFASKVVGILVTILTALWHEGPNVVDWLEIASDAQTLLDTAPPIMRPVAKPRRIR